MIPSNGAPSAAAANLTIRQRYVAVTCDDPDGCNITVVRSGTPQVSRATIACFTVLPTGQCVIVNQPTVVSGGIYLGNKDVVDLIDGGYEWIRTCEGDNAATASP